MSKFYITTSIPYVNAEPHLGHALEFLQADVLARYRRGRGEEVLFATGTDEHGGKVLEKAREAGAEPQAFVDANSQKFLQLCEQLNVSFDRFVRTSAPAHKQASQHFWTAIGEYIYKGTYKGYYDTGEEEFVPENEAKRNNGVSPHNGRPYEILEEENYFFALSKFTEPIKQAIETGSFRIEPESRRNEILSVLKDGLEDISISRPAEKIPWGVAVPGDESQVMYVWFEALLNYISVLGYPDHADFKKFWPADVQVIGKNIIRFHAAIWPAMLLAAGIELPRSLFVHGFITVEGKKMGKSLGNAIDPHTVLARYGVDPFRYYLLHEIPATSDGDFSWQKFDEVYNADLADDLGNLVQRVATMVAKYESGVIGDAPKSGHDVGAYERAMQAFRFDKAIEEVWALVRNLNQYIEEQKPWELAKQAQTDHLTEILTYLVGGLLQVADLLAPFLPETAEKIHATFAEGVVNKEIGMLFPKYETTN